MKPKTTILNSHSGPKHSQSSLTPPTEPGIKRLTIQTEAHAFEYADFKDKTPQEHYGAGTVTFLGQRRLMVEEVRGRVTYCFTTLRMA